MSLTQQQIDDIVRQARQDRHDCCNRLVAAGIEPTEARLEEMMSETMLRSLPALIKKHHEEEHASS